MIDPEALVARAEEGVRRAEAAGADAAEVYLWSASGNRVMKGGDYQMAKESDASGLAIRLLAGGRKANASTDGIAQRDLEWAIDRALESAAYVPESPAFEAFPRPSEEPGPPTPVHEGVLDGDVDRMVAIAEKAGDRIEKADGIDYYEIVAGGMRGTYAVANSQGLTAWDRNGYEQCGIELRFEHEGEHKYTNRSAYSRAPLDFATDVEDEVLEGIDRIQSTAQRGSLDGAVTTALFDPVAARTLVAKLVPALRGLGAHRERSHLSDKLGELIAAEEFTLVDAPRGEDGIRQQRTDDEGIPTQRTPIVEDGILETFLFDWSSAQIADAEPTGHGFRPRPNRHNGGPGARPCNLEMAPGSWSREAMLEDVERGVLVKGPFLGSFTSSPVTGDFSLVAPLTFLVEDGMVQHVVPSTTVSGNLFEMLEEIRAVGEDTKRTSGGTASPMLVDGVTAVA